MGFRFPLATVLSVREGIEKREERSLQKIQMEMARIASQMEELATMMEHAHRKREHAMRTPIPASHLQGMLGEIEAAAEKKKILYAALHRLECQREEQVKVYREALRAREMLTGIRDQQREAYDLHQARAQQKYLDDIFMARRHRS